MQTVLPPGAGGPAPTGTWGVDSYWNPTADGSSTPTQAWNDTKGAVFSAGSDAAGTFTVTVSGTQTAAFLTFEEGNVTLSGGSLILSDAGGPINVCVPGDAHPQHRPGRLHWTDQAGCGHADSGRAQTLTPEQQPSKRELCSLAPAASFQAARPWSLANSAPDRATFATGGFSQSLGALSLPGI